VIPKLTSVSSASANTRLLRKVVIRPTYDDITPLPQFWYDKGLIWQFINGQLPPNAVPVGADSYASLVTYMRATEYCSPPPAMTKPPSASMISQ
jgi:hypothetical protein